MRVAFPETKRTWCCDAFPSIDKIHRIRSIVLIIHGTDDDVIDVSHGFALYSRIHLPHQIEPLWVDGAGHNDIEVRGSLLSLSLSLMTCRSSLGARTICRTLVTIDWCGHSRSLSEEATRTTTAANSRADHHRSTHTGLDVDYSGDFANQLRRETSEHLPRWSCELRTIDISSCFPTACNVICALLSLSLFWSIRNRKMHSRVNVSWLGSPFSCSIEPFFSFLLLLLYNQTMWFNWEHCW